MDKMSVTCKPMTRAMCGKIGKKYSMEKSEMYINQRSTKSSVSISF